MPAPTITEVHFDRGNLRYPRGQNGRNSKGEYVITVGYLRGNNICDIDGDFFTKNYDVNIVTRSGKKKWTGRIIRKFADGNGISTDWIFVVLNSLNESDPTSETEVVNVTVTNPNTGTSPPQSSTVNLEEIP